MDGRHEITVSTGTFVKAIVVGVAAYLVWFLRDLVLLILTAIVLASAIEPAVAFFQKHRVPRVLAVLFMYLVIFGSLFGIVYVFFPPILEDAQAAILSAPQYLETLNVPSSLVGIQEAAEQAAGEGSTQSLIDTFLSFRSAFTDTSEGAFRLVASFFGGIFALLLVIVLSFYFAIQDTGVDDFLRLVTPPKHEAYVLDLWQRAKNKIGQWMQGQLLLSLISGIIIYLGLSILGVPYALLLAVFTAVSELIPIFGSFIAAVPAILIAFSTGGLTLAIIVTGLFVIMNLFQANLIYPLVVKQIVGVPPLMVILALIIGGSIAGFLGVLLSVPVAAAIREFLNDVDRGKKRAKATTS